MKENSELIVAQRERSKKWLLHTAGIAAIASIFLFTSLKLFRTVYIQDWKFQTGNRIDWYPIRGGKVGPLSFDESSLYVSNLDGYTYSLNPETGSERWRFRTDMYSIYEKATDNDSLVFLSDFDGRIYALDRHTGKEQWRFVTPGLIKTDTEPLVADNIVFFGSRNGVLYALDKNTGKEKWEYKTKGINQRILVKNEILIHFGTFVVDEKNIYINSASDNTIYALNQKTGEERWRFDRYQHVHEKPMLGNTTITFRSNNEYFFTLDKETGQEKWRWVAKTGKPQSVFVAGNTLYYVDGNNTLSKYSSDGQIKAALWKYHSDEFIPDIRERFVMSENKIYLTTLSKDGIGRILVLNDETGREDWQFRAEGFIANNPQVESDRVFASDGGNLYALKNTSGELVWKYSMSGQSHLLNVTDDGIVLVNVNKDGSVTVYDIDKTGGKEQWRKKLDDVDIGTLTVDSGRLYGLSKDQTGVYSIGGDNGGKVADDHDVKVVLSSDLQSKNRKIGSPSWVIEEIVKPMVTKLGQTHIFGKNNEIQVTQNEDMVEKFGVFELTIIHDDLLYDNVWEDVKIAATFTDENGKTLNARGFYFDKNTWKVRLSPTSTGRWTWSLTLTSPVVRVKKTGTFGVSSSVKPGFVRIRPDNHRLVFDNGELFAALGLQDCFVDRNHTGDVLNQLSIGGDATPQEDPSELKLWDLESYLSVYGPQGAGFNLFRVNVDNCSEKLWREIDRNGNGYSVNAGMREDRLMQVLTEHQYRIWMSLFSFELPLQGSIKERSYRNALERYIDYIIARYGAYVDVWELTNEIQTDDEWIRVIAEHLRAVDPYKHPITTNWARPDIDEIEIDSLHWYHSGDEATSDIAIADQIDREKQWGKPIVFSEIGNQGINWDKHSALRMRLKLWTGFFKGTSLIFWNTSGGIFRHEGESANIYLGPLERQYTKVFREFIKDLDPNITQEKLEVENDEIRGYGLSSEKYLLAYLHNGGSHAEVTKTSVHVNVKRDGILQWNDPKTGRVIGLREVQSGGQTIQTPNFRIDLAMKITFQSQ